MNREYYIRLRGTVRGPYPAERLRELAQRGQFSKIHQVSTDGTHWEAATDHPELLPPAKSFKKRKVAAGNDDRDELLELEDPVEVTTSEVPDGGSSSRASQDDWPWRVRWYYAQAGRELGPVSFQDLKVMVWRGELRYNDYVWGEGTDDWIEAFSVPGLFSEQNIADAAAKAARYPKSVENLPPAPMAIASLICGILGVTLCPGIASLPAVFCGHLARKQIREQGNLAGGRGLSTAGILLGYAGIVLTLVLFLAAILLMVLRLGEDPSELAG